MCLRGTPTQIDCKLCQKNDFLYVGLVLRIVKISKLIFKLLPLLVLERGLLIWLPTGDPYTYTLLASIWSFLGTEGGLKVQILKIWLYHWFITYKKQTSLWFWWRSGKKFNFAVSLTIIFNNFRGIWLTLGKVFCRKFKSFEKGTFLGCYKCFNLKSHQRKINSLHSPRCGKWFYIQCASEAHTWGE